MNHVEINLFFNELRLRAVENALADEGLTVEDEFKEHFKFLYEQLVPAEQQLSIEAEIEKIDAEEKAEIDSRRRFGVFHIRENNSDHYFTSDLFQSLMGTAYRYRLYDRGELSSEPKMFAEAFGEVQSISADEYNKLCDQMQNDIRIKMIAHFDLDNGIASSREHNEDSERTFSLKDLSTAAYRAYRGTYRSSTDRAEKFEEALNGKEISLSKENSMNAETTDNDEEFILKM